MFEQWYYTRNGTRCGPVSLVQAVRLAEQGVLLPNELFWPDDVDPRFAFKAEATLDFAALRKNSLPLPSAPASLPGWLDDVRHVEGQRARPQLKPATPVRPDWLGDVEQVERFVVRKPAPAPARRAAPALRQPPTEPTRRTETPAEMGYNPETGQILDEAKFRLWQKREQQKRQAELDAAGAGESVYEAFRRARREVELWVDARPNWPLVSGSGAVLRRAPQTQRLIQEFDRFGPEMVQKLWHHLEFMAENRRKHHAARGG